MNIKKSLDIPEELLEKIMDYAHKKKIYKFVPAALELLEKAIEGEDR